MRKVTLKNRLTLDVKYVVTEPYPFEGLKLQLDINSPSQRYMYEHPPLNTTYEEDTVDVILKYLTKEDTFIDIGAHVGYFTVLGSHLANKVYAFEPDKTNYDNLVRNCKINGLNNVETFQLAVGDCNRKVSFYENLDNDGGHALWNPGVHPFNQWCKENVSMKIVDQGTLDTMVDFYKIDKVKMIKIDTEGAEVLILRGMEKTLKNKYLKVVICEHNDFGMQNLGTNGGEIFEIMCYNGFTPYNEHMELITPENCKDNEKTENMFFIRE